VLDLAATCIREYCEISGGAIVTIQDDKVSLLHDTLAEARVSVRTYDTKAQIVGIGYIFTLAILAQIGGAISDTIVIDFKVLILLWGVVILPIVHFGFVLYPTRRSAPRLASDEKSDIKNVLYVSSERQLTISAFKAVLEESNAMDELVHEILKISALRDLKRRRFLRALHASAICFIIVFIFQILRVL